MTERERKATHFGFEEVAEEEKATRVAGVFDSVASRYDLMNDVMSVGLHRVWKAFAVRQANVRPGMKVLDIAGGTGDLAKAFAQRAGTSGEVWLTDINGVDARRRARPHARRGIDPAARAVRRRKAALSLRALRSACPWPSGCAT